MKEKIVFLLKRLIFICFSALFFVTPLIVFPLTSELFEFNKMFFVYFLAVVIGASWIIREIGEDRKDKGNIREFWDFRVFRVRKTPLDIPIFLFLLSQVLATVFSIDRHMSLWGYYSRQNGGLLSTISYVVLYYALVNNIWKIGNRGNKGNIRVIKGLLKSGLAGGLLVAGYGIAQHFGVDKELWVQDVQRRVFSTLGQPNWLAAYMGVLGIIAMGFGVERIREANNRGDKGNKGNKGETIRDYFWFGVVLVFYLVILYTKSRSGLLGFWAGYGVFLRARLIGGQVFFGLSFGLLALTFAVGVPVERVNKWMMPGIIEKVHIIDRGEAPGAGLRETGTALESGGTESGEIRKYVWQAAINIWRANPLVGTGVETFAWAFYKYKPAGHNLTSEWDFLYNKAHNEYLNFLAASGAAGLGSYLLLIGVFAAWMVRNLRYLSNLGVILGLFAGWVALLVTNFFGFSVVVTNLYFWLIPALIFAFGTVRSKGSTPHQSLRHGTEQGFKAGKIATVGVLFLAGVLLFTLGKYWYADILYTKGGKLVEAGFAHQGADLLESAVALRPEEPIFWDKLAQVKGELALQAYERKDINRTRELVEQAIASQTKAIKLSPYNFAFLKSRVRLFYSFSAINEEFFGLAVGTLDLARELAPNDPKILYNLALLYAAAPLNGVSLKEAKGLLRDALLLKSNYIEAGNLLKELEAEE